MSIKYIYSLLVITILLSCKSTSLLPENTQEIQQFNFVNEVIIPADAMYDGVAVGGLSSIDYVDGKWYIISDDRKDPRFYIADIKIENGKLQSPVFTFMVNLKDTLGIAFKSGLADPESLRVTPSKDIIWSSEGNISKGINPFIRISSIDGAFKSAIVIPSRYLVQNDLASGPHNNGIFEALTRNYDNNGFWVTTELPLKQDGIVPTASDANSPVRIAYIDHERNTFTREYAYILDKVARNGKLEVNGVTEILSYDEHSFLVLERSYASGHDDGGNDVKIYQVSTKNATDINDLNSLSNSSYIPATKKLLLDFSSVRSQLTDGIVDNIEGMTFGPNFENGNRSLVVISDNNFNSFGKQLSQIILFEIK
ncbi:esterase-like activity of phytase family protein [uncultured Dokdonia sp.]|uniref:esterase-like activity of phytase family protein n=1 Tax=Dokdonia sp. R78006 TaxID=3093866 RepID=UPI00262F3C9C|nr:esterase-like activity of phytase family protein [uncultured Dokdonia sp.]